jgi:hypothetical protein
MDGLGRGTTNTKKRSRDDDDEEALKVDKVCWQLTPYNPLPTLFQRLRNDSVIAPSPFAHLRRPSISHSRLSPFPLCFTSSPPPPPPDSPDDHDSPSSTRSLSPASARSLPILSDTVPDIDMHDSFDAVSIAGSHSPSSSFKETPTSARPVKPAMLDPQSLVPNARLANEHFNGGRAPTPIFPSFAASVSAQCQSQTHSAPASVQTADESFAQAPSYLMQRPKPVFESDSRIPSPIHEDVMETADTQLSRLSFRNSIEEGMSMDLELDTAVNHAHHPVEEGQRVDSAIEPGSATEDKPIPLARKGRARSGAISSSPDTPRSWHGLSGRRFYMGYRDDCEKCRNRTPGHFAHFLPG